MTGFIVPPGSVVYSAPVQAYPSRWRSALPNEEPDQAIPLPIDWSQAGSAFCIQFNIGSRAQKPFNAVQALWVNNEHCGADIDFIFPDTGFALTVAAYDSGIYPVVSLSNNFFAVAANAVAGDFSNLVAFNFLPPPVAFEKAEFTQVNANGTVALNTAGTTTYAVAGTVGKNGFVKLVGFQPSRLLGGAAAGGAVVTLVDGRPFGLARAEFWAAAGESISNPPPVVFPDKEERFVNGLSFVVLSLNTTLVNGAVVANLDLRITN